MPQSPNASWNPGRVLLILQEVAKDPTPILVGIGTLLRERSRMAFSEQRRGASRWPGRNVPNIAGIIADLTQGKSPPMRRLDPRPALVDRGTLRDSIAYRITARDTVEVGTRLPYAGVHQFGGESVQQVTPAVKTAVAKLLKREPWATYDDKLGALLRDDVTTWTTQIPERPFVMVTAEDRKDIVRIILDAFKGKAAKVTFQRAA